MSSDVYIGRTKVPKKTSEAKGEITKIDGEEYYVIKNVDRMDPFFMTIVSSSDHWMFISSNGGLTAGRKNAENSLFPYYSDEKVTDSADSVGSKTIFRVDGGDRLFLWEPFSKQGNQQYSLTRNLFKNRFGSRIIFEETNHDLSLQFRYSWQFSEKYGFVKQAEIHNLADRQQHLHLLDGLQNVLPSGVNTHTQNFSSNLVNGYKRSVLVPNGGIGVFSLSAMIVDRAEPSEALRATTVWQNGLDVKAILLSDKQVDAFRYEGTITQEHDIKGTSGAYFCEAELTLQKGENRIWHLIAEVNQDRAALSDLSASMDDSLVQDVRRDIRTTAERLKILVAKADGLQLTDDKMTTGRHASNVLFNIMRGGIFEDNYEIEIDDFLAYLKEINRTLHATCHDQYASGQTVRYRTLIDKAEKIGDSDLIRITYEYLPLTFSRRHGDPSRPWNRFNIDLKHPDGSKKRSYEGNWRDIFQNWEALAYSFPDYAPGMIFKFLNATTVDGYNPYRITRQGIDWEVIEPDDPWSYIGYWGDHQIIYLQKLLECAHRHDASVFDHWYQSESFVYTNVPYIIKPYDEIVANPKDTIDFDEEKEREIAGRVAEWGADGKFVFQGSGLLKASFMEKLLVTLLAKLSNFVPEGGIWLNTQRPEWNDANNALVGNGLSMVTLYYMRRFCHFMAANLRESKVENFQIHTEVADLFLSLSHVLSANEKHLSDAFSNEVRKTFVDEVGRAGEAYRQQAYVGFSGEKSDLTKKHLVDFLQKVNQFIDHSIRANKRADGLFHAYNLLEFDGAKLKVDPLYEMLEGQVAVLSSGYLDGAESLSVLNALKSSEMFRQDQYSYFLYPNRDIPHFLEKNQLPKEFVQTSELINAVRRDGNSYLVTFDKAGNGYFNGDIHNGADVKARLEELTKYKKLVSKEGRDVLRVFEEMFDHKSFTGRSGTFFAFEGLGSIYWHMVSKLLLATQESLLANQETMSPEVKGHLTQHYYEVRAGIGINKNPSLYGAFPTDPYSHTPLHKGAQQPGMTGQVKEDVLNRWAELGVSVSDGVISFGPSFLNLNEFLKEEAAFEYYDIRDEMKVIQLTTRQLAFTYCQVPVVYELAEKSEITVTLSGETNHFEGGQLSKELSAEIFGRTGMVEKIHVSVNL